MTISNTDNRVRYDGDGSQTAFSVTFPFFDTGDLEVYLIDSSDVATLQTISTHYTVSGGDGSTGTVTMTTAPASGEKLLIVRALPLTQETDYTENDPFPAGTHEDALDRLTLIAQQQKDELDRAIRIRTHDVKNVPDTTLPAPVAKEFLRWNEDGDGFDSADPGDVALATPGDSSVTAAKLDGTDMAAIRAKIELPVNVQDHGATGDGTTDDTAAIKTAITNVSDGGTLYFPPGTYIVGGSTTGFTIDKAMTITGDPGALIKIDDDSTLFNTGTTPLFFIRKSHVRVIGLRIDGNSRNNFLEDGGTKYYFTQSGDPVSANNTNLIFIQGKSSADGGDDLVTDVIVRDCWLKDSSNAAVQVSGNTDIPGTWDEETAHGCDRISVVNNVATHGQRSTFVFINGVRNSTMRGNICHDPYWVAFRFYLAVRNCSMVGNHVDFNGDAIDWTLAETSSSTPSTSLAAVRIGHASRNTGTVQKSVVSGNVVRVKFASTIYRALAIMNDVPNVSVTGNRLGEHVEIKSGASAVSVVGNEIECPTSGGARAGVDADAATHVNIASNLIHDANNCYGVRATGACRHVNITGNVVHAIKKSGGGADRDGILIDNGPRYVLVANNIVHDVDNAGDGIVTRTCDDVRIVGNRISKVGGGGIDLRTTSVNVDVIGNLIDDSDNTASAQGIAISGTSTSGIHVRENRIVSFTTALSGSANAASIQRNIGYVTENADEATFSGDGSTTAFQFAHGCDDTPKAILQPTTADASGDFHYTADGTNVTVTYGTAPASGTDNVKLTWEARVR